MIEELEFLKSYDLNINKKKNKTLTFDADLFKAPTEAGIEAVKEFKYLGVKL